MVIGKLTGAGSGNSGFSNGFSNGNSTGLSNSNGNTTTPSSTAAGSVAETMSAINQALRSAGGAYKEYSCKTVSWDDVQRGTVGGALSCWGGNITDTRLWERHGRQLFTVRSDNWNEKLGRVSSDEIALISGNQAPGGGALAPMTLRTFLRDAGAHGKYAGLPAGTDLSDAALDAKVSIRFSTTFLPVADEELAALEFAPEMYNYQTRSDADPRNLLLLATTQGIALQQDGAGAKKLFHHACEPDGTVCRYWFEAERSSKKVGGAQKETREEALAAAKRGKATSAVIGTRAMGTRFNVLMTIQVPLAQQKMRDERPKGMPMQYALCAPAMTNYAMWGAGGGFGGMDGAEAMAEDDECEEELMAGSFDMDEGADLCLGACAPPPPTAGPPPLPAGAAAGSMSRCRRSSPKPAAPPRKGTSNAARVSRGTMVDRWGGLGVKTPKRDPSQHVTVTVVIYNTVAGGVPAAEDVKAAIDDMERLYASCGWSGRLADAGAAFMKEELTVKQAADIHAKLTEQPYVPPAGEAGLVVGGGVFPTA